MNITKKFDRAFQWAGEKMGSEAKTSMSDDFKALETEMALRYDGMDRLQKSMNAYVKWMGRRGETFEDKEKGLPASYLGRTMVSHGEDFESDSEFGTCLMAMGRANERVAAVQEHYVADATSTWLESLERSLAMMKEYQAARKKLENRRLAYDASMTKMQKAKRDDFRIEEELRTNKAKYEESSEDVMRRMQDIKDAEADSVRDLTGFLDAELDFYERCADELRRVRQHWAAGAGASSGSAGRSRSNTARSYTGRLSRTNSHNVYEEEPEPEPVRLPIRSNGRVANASGHGNGHGNGNGHGHGNGNRPDVPLSPRPTVGRASTFQGRAVAERNGTTQKENVANVGALRAGLRPVARIQTSNGGHSNVFGDDGDDTASGSGSPEWGERSTSPATSLGSLSRSTSNLGTLGSRKAPPPPPPSRAKKPPPPVPTKREAGY